MVVLTNEAYLYPDPVALDPTDPATGAALMALPIERAQTAGRAASSRRARPLAQQWDLGGVLALILASAGSGVYSLTHLV